MDGEDSPKEMYFFYESLSEIILLWMEEILHQLIDGLSHYLKGFNHPRWCRIYSIHSMIDWWFIVLIITNDPDKACD